MFGIPYITDTDDSYNYYIDYTDGVKEEVSYRAK